MKQLVRNLKNNSIEAFALSLETINRPTVTYRAESFCFLFCNAWELLMKAKILSDGYKIFRTKKRGKTRESISLDECLDRIFTTENDPIKLNIERISELRNNAIHLVIPFIPVSLMSLFQAGVINYPQKLKEWFDTNLSDRIPLGMMAIIYDFDPKKHSLENARMNRKLPSETIKWLTAFERDLLEQSKKITTDTTQFCIPINYRLAIIKNPKKSDIVPSSGKVGKEAIIVEVAKDANKTHAYRGRTHVVDLVNERLDGKQIITFFDINCIKKVYKIEQKPEFCWLPLYSSPQYSGQFIDWIVKEANKDPEFFIKTRGKANIHTKKKKNIIA